MIYSEPASPRRGLAETDAVMKMSGKSMIPTDANVSTYVIVTYIVVCLVTAAGMWTCVTVKRRVKNQGEMWRKPARV